MRILPFDSVHAALVWYYNESWVKGPADARALPLVRIRSSYRHEDPEEIVSACLAIRAIVERLSDRAQCFLRDHYCRKNPAHAEASQKYDLSDRQGRNIRAKALGVLEPRMIKTGIVKIPEPGEMRNAAE